MDQTTLKVLKMVEEGTVTAEQAAEFLSAAQPKSPVHQEASSVVPTQQPQRTSAVAKKTLSSGSPEKEYDKRLFRTIVDSPSGDHVNIQFPVGGVKKLLKATGKIPLPEKQLPDVDLKALMDAVTECLSEEVKGDFVTVTASDGTIVRIFVE